MRYIIILVFTTLWGCGVSSQSKLKLVWNDEFDYTGLPDTTKWSYDVGGHGWGNNELQFYTENREKSARIEDGKLIIEAHKESFENMDYTSARLVTKSKGDWKYGRIEVKAKIPKGKGTWPAIWMLPTVWKYGNWPSCGEIDIMEHVGYDPTVIHATIHTEAYNHKIKTQKAGQKKVDDAFTNFHVYAVEWSEEKLDFYIDDEVIFTYKNENTGYKVWPFDIDYYLILNIAIGGDWGGLKGIDPDICPARMEVDYVRVYSDE